MFRPSTFSQGFNLFSQLQVQPTATNIFSQAQQQPSNIFAASRVEASSAAGKAPNMFQSRVLVPNLFALPPSNYTSPATLPNPFLPEQPSFFKLSQPNNLFSTAPVPSEKAEVKCPPLKP